MARLILDANVLIALVDRTDIHHQWGFGFARETADYAWALSALTFAEVLVQPTRANRENSMLKAVESLRIETVDFMAANAEPVARIRATTGLKIPDAVVLQTAISEKAALATTDKQLAKHGRALGLTVFSPNFRD